YTWSPDGRFLAYTRDQRVGYQAVFVWDSRDGKTHQVTASTTSDHSPAWDPQGRYLYFVSDRATNPHIGERDFQVTESGTSVLVMTLLRPDVEDPFARDAGLPGAEPPIVIEKRKKKKKRQKEEGELDDGASRFDIAWDGLVDRQITLDVPNGTYFSLSATDDALFFVSYAGGGFRDDGAMSLQAFDLEDEEVAEVASGISGYEMAADREKMVIAKWQNWYVVDARPGPADFSDSLVDTSGIDIQLDPREEWRQIYFEAWRHMRDFFWDRDLGGLDWVKVRDQYATLLPRLSTRQELSDLLGELIGELGTSHTYVGGGDASLRIDWEPAGLLGAELVREGDAYRVARIWKADPADELVSPLLRPGQEVKEGEYIVGVAHRPLVADRPIWAELEGKADVSVVLQVNSRPSFQGARTVVVTPVRNDYDLRHADWVRRNRETVAARTDGKIGYLHIPDMGATGLMAFETWYYAQLDKEGLIVDCRWNRGGWASQLMLQRLARRPIGFNRAAGGGVEVFPAGTLNGPFVVLTNEFAGSDGDIFPKSIQELKLAPVIGMRSWGGVVGIRADKPLVDGGFLSQPEYAFWFRKGGWGVENHGVDPDVVVQNLPQDLAKNLDPQLQRAIDEVLRLRQENPPLKPDFEAEPTKTRDAFGQELPQ
ncbi:MAG: PDZ domain-containing protein, partial [Myxococcales bacterium]|nr:PDZ domain-containing protein [Myxococcales bacterium]